MFGERLSFFGEPLWWLILPIVATTSNEEKISGFDMKDIPLIFKFYNNVFDLNLNCIILVSFLKATPKETSIFTYLFLQLL